MSALNTITSQNPKITADKICRGQLEIIKFVEELNPVLTNGSHDIRLQGLRALTKVITSLPTNLLSEKEIEVLCEFLCLRLVDHSSMEQPVLNCLSYFIDCEKKPNRFNKTLLEFLKTKTNVQKMDIKNRTLVYEITRKILIEKQKKVKNIDSELVYSLIHMIEGESNPQNLLLCFNMVSFVMKSFQDLEPYIDDLFEWLSSYYPIDYTPSEDDTASLIVLRTDLVQALYDCFYANELNAANLQTLLLEKLDSNLMSTKLESLNCLIQCYERFTLKSVKDYASSLWTCIRMDCLKKTTLVDPKLLEMSYRALSSLAKKLAEDDEVYFTFISDMYEELAIAFRKPEMELFEPAAQLLSNAAQPRIKGFNYILNLLIPIFLNVPDNHKISVIKGLTYIYEQLCEHHTESKLMDNLRQPQSKLVDHLLESSDLFEVSTKLLKAMIRFKVELTGDTLSRLVDGLKKYLEKSKSIDLEECLAIAALNYKFSSIITDSTKSVDFDNHSLIKLIENFNESQDSQFIIYLRLMILLFDNMTQSEMSDINQENLNKFLLGIREKASQLSSRNDAIETIAKLHFIIINKIEQQRVDSILMKLFSSNFCQKLVPVSENREEEDLLCKVYLPILRWVLRSLALRNHHLTSPLINLILNFITSSKVSEESAIVGSQVFSFVISNCCDNFSPKRHYQIFALYKQKFYAQTCKEIRIRYDIEKDLYRKHLIISTLALQIPHLEAPIFKREFDWILRELIKVLNNSKPFMDGNKSNEELIGIVYHCLESLIKRDGSGNMLGLLNSLVDLDLTYANQAQKLVTRKLALDNLYCIASSFKDQELLLLRQRVVSSLKPCLNDKKRLVRQAASQARLKWILVGQPIGP